VKLDEKTYNKSSLFNIDYPQDKNTWVEVKEGFEKETTHEKLVKIQNRLTTQPNESLNMQAVEVAPKYKKYSQTEYFTYRIAIVVDHHNLGLADFHTKVFTELKIDLDTNLKT